MAAKKTAKTAKKTKTTKTTTRQQKQIDLEGEDMEVRSGSHPIFHDLERQDALRKTASRKDPDIDLLRNLLADADERLCQIANIAGRVRDVLGDKEAKNDEDIPDAVERLHNELQEANDARESLTEDLAAAKQALIEINVERDVIKANAAGAEYRYKHTLTSLVEERDAALAAQAVAAEALKEALSSLDATEHVVSELASVEALATAFATMVGDEKQRQERQGEGPAIIDMTQADPQTIAFFETALAVLEA